MARALSVWSDVAHTLIDVAYAHAKTHLPVGQDEGGGGGVDGTEPDEFRVEISTSTACRPGTHPTQKSVVIEIASNDDDLQIAAPAVRRITPGVVPAPASSGYQDSKIVGNPATLPPHTTTIKLLLDIGGPISQGLHVGQIRTIAGAAHSPIVFYVDSVFET